MSAILLPRDDVGKVMNEVLRMPIKGGAERRCSAGESSGAARRAPTQGVGEHH